MPGHIHQPGGIGVVSRPGTLCYETTAQTAAAGLGQSSVVGIRGDPVNGLNYVNVLEFILADPDTEAMVMIGEIGGTAEVDAAEFLKSAKGRKPVAAFIAGASAALGRRMGHAGAIVSSGKETAQAKKDVLRAAGIEVAESTVEIGEALHRARAA
jgi:succinyl-CoA synthetase alpha subunit